MLTEELVVRLRSRRPAERLAALDEVALETDPDHLAALIDALSDRHPGVKIHARRLLTRMTGRDHGFAREEWTSWWRESAHRVCQVCQKRLFDQKLYYRVKADVTCEPREVVLTEEDLAQDSQARIDEICAQLNDRTTEEIEDEVWVRLEYYLCVPCKKSFVKRVRRTRDA